MLASMFDLDYCCCFESERLFSMLLRFLCPESCAILGGGNPWSLRVCNIVFPSTVPFCFLYFWFSSLALSTVFVISQPTNQPTDRLAQLEFCFLYFWFSSLALSAVFVISQPTNQPTDRLAQLVEHRTAVREVAGSKPRRDQHSGSLNN